MKFHRSFAWSSLAVVVAVLACAIFASRLKPQPPPPLREVAAGELIVRDGRCYFQAEATPFTGIITERYPDGALKSRSALSNGLMHGVSEGWHTNGNLQVRENFHEGVSHGIREKWFPTGTRVSEATIQSGRMEGLFRKWHENGALAEEIRMKDGNPDGISTAYHPDGSLKAKATVQNGKVIEQKSWNVGEFKETQEVSRQNGT